ncbi:MAG: hypothetical protein K9H49_06950 [Bacteroidales bacterium]|nr:hypothetical protein [Bacteroidales bacterium]MCF8404132.1 hypothetical protein [Bacteroidales bacterium]
MIRRKALLFLNLFAFSITLALMVLPHHHHEGDICILNAACHSDHHDEGDEKEDHTHDHNSCSNDHSCLLEQEIVFRSDNLEHLLKASESVDNRIGYDGFWMAKSGSNIIFSAPPYYARIQIVHNSSLYSCLVSPSYSLRGPPTA